MNQLKDLLGKLSGKRTYIIGAVALAYLLGDGKLTDIPTFDGAPGGETLGAGIIAMIVTVKAAIDRAIKRLNEALDKIDKVEAAVKLLTEGAPK